MKEENPKGEGEKQEELVRIAKYDSTEEGQVKPVDGAKGRHRTQSMWQELCVAGRWRVP